MKLKVNCWDLICKAKLTDIFIFFCRADFQYLFLFVYTYSKLIVVVGLLARV